MKDYKQKIILVIMCCFLGLILMMQFRTVQYSTSGEFLSNDKVKEGMAELEMLRKENEKLQKVLKALENEIEGHEIVQGESSYSIKALHNNLEELRRITGYKTIEGSGIVIKIEEVSKPPEEDFFWSNKSIAYGLTNLVNILNMAGAEEIAINEQKYRSTTSIQYSDTEGTVKVNDVPISPPYVVKAIGNSKQLEETLIMPFGFVDQFKSDESLNRVYDIKVSKTDNVNIPKYNRPIEFKYAKPMETSL